MLQILRSRRGKIPVVMILVVVVALALAGTGFVLFKGGGKKDSKKEAHETLLPLPEFVLNLADTDEARYLKMEISLGVKGDSHGGGGHGGTDPRMPIIRDTIISVTGRHTYSELLNDSGKEQLKVEIVQALEKAVKDLHVSNVYFTNFAMQ